MVHQCWLVSPVLLQWQADLFHCCNLQLASVFKRDWFCFTYLHCSGCPFLFFLISTVSINASVIIKDLLKKKSWEEKKQKQCKLSNLSWDTNLGGIRKANNSDTTLAGRVFLSSQAGFGNFCCPLHLVVCHNSLCPPLS